MREAGLAGGDAASRVEIFHARTAEVFAEGARVARALEWLSPAEHARFSRYRHDSDREMFLLGRTMARALVGRALAVAPDAWTWGEGPRGRPHIAHPAGHGLSFNIAHSAGLVACALAEGGDVGVDVEYRLRPPIDPRMVRRYCAPAEVADIESRGDDGWRDQFLKYWTLKEAYLKARGLGIAVPLADLSFTLDGQDIRLDGLAAPRQGAGERWAFLLAESNGTHYMAAAAPAGHHADRLFTVAPFPADLLP
jgi:4'-phosphopantetheinyl transferase